MQPILVIFVISTQIILTRTIYELDCKEYMSEYFSELQRHKDDIYSFDDAEFRVNKTSYENQYVQIQHDIVKMSETAEHQCQCTHTNCNCSGLNLKQVPANLPVTLRKLIISQNSISALPNCTFCNYVHLAYLDLSTNNLSQLEIGSFQKLHYLIYLSLKNNSLLYLEKNFPMGVFSDLQSLKHLILNRNIQNRFDHSLNYPDETLSELSQLETLYLDGLEFLVFGKYFRKLSNLRTLVLAGFMEGYCKIIGLFNSSFENVRQVTKLNVSNCNIVGKKLSEGIFEPLANLTNLDISFNLDFGVGYLMRELSFMREFNITTLRMNFIESMYSPSITINKTMVQSLPLYLTYLEAQGNNFQYVEQGALKMLPPNISFIDVGGNRFYYGPYILELYAMENLKVLNIDQGYDLHKIPRYVPSFISSQQRQQVSTSENRLEPLIFRLPPSLLCLDLRFAGLRYIFSELVFNETNSLQSLILSNNIFPILEGPVEGLKKLKRLFLSNCMYLQKLKVLDISINALSAIHGEFFHNLVNLVEINLSQNNLYQFNISMANLSSLKVLNLSHAQLNSLPVQTRLHIDFLLTKHAVTVDLSNNPIHCDCINLDFLNWMVSSKAFDSNFTNYLCKYEDGSYKIINDSYLETLHYLFIKCADHSLIFLIVVSATLCMLTFVAAAVLYRFRWKIRYIYYAAYLMLKSKKVTNGEEAEHFRYDVFISYAYQDEEFILDHILPELTKRKLKALVHGRDFAIGEFIASNIVTAVKESTFELQMANMESVHTGRPVLLFLIKESIPTAELNSDLLYHLNKNTYTVYPQATLKVRLKTGWRLAGGCLEAGWVLVGGWLGAGWRLVGGWLGAGWRLAGGWLGAGWRLAGCWLEAGWMLVGGWLGAGWRLVGGWLEAGWMLAGCWLEAGWRLAGCWLEAGWMLVGCWLGAGWRLAGCWLEAGWMLVGAGWVLVGGWLDAGWVLVGGCLGAGWRLAGWMLGGWLDAGWRLAGCWLEAGWVLAGGWLGLTGGWDNHSVPEECHAI
ncbi:hypothetical protein Btru_026411 [Bulinus truncatus]|nr:hypothetical protein Btru_026411 [Bulinus truncatus]